MISKKVPIILSVLVLGFIFSGCPSDKLEPHPSTLEFTKVYIGDSFKRSGWWQNYSGNDAEIKGLVVEPSPVFTTSTVLVEQPVKAGENSTQYDFVFKPESVGEVTGTATILASGARPKKMTLRGEGIYLRTGKFISLNGGDLVKDEPLDFKDVMKGKTKNLVFTLKNADPDKAVTLKVSFMKNTGAFKVTDPSGDITLQSKGEAKVTVAFTPAEVKDYADILEFTDPKSPYNLSGTVVKGKGVQG